MATNLVYYAALPAVMDIAIVIGDYDNLVPALRRVRSLGKRVQLVSINSTNGTLEQNGTIILDEPEIHLHPEWQLIFAELIVLIQKKFGMHILLNTHSPYFLNAIEVYSTKYGIEDKCKYYMTNANQDGSVIEDVSDNIEKIYKKLARPLQELENERYNDD